VLDRPLERLARSMTFNPSAVLIATALARAVGGADRRVWVQDYSLMLRAAGAGARFALLSRPVAAVPETAEGRLSQNQAQVLHDLNAALGWFVHDHPGTGLAGLMAARAAARAWHWAQRRHGATFASREFARYLSSKTRLGDPLSIIRASCLTFRRLAPIRVPDAGDESGAH
jgi:hypothetical protein